MMRYLSNVVLAVMLLSLAGCGFHLRGSADLATSLSSMYVQGIDLNSSVGRSLKSGLKVNGVNVVKSYQAGAAVLTVLEHNVEKRVLSVSGGNAKVSEYELYGLINYKITDDQGQIIAKPQKVEAFRDYQFDESRVLATAEEEQRLRKELEQQLVQALIRRLSTLK